MSIIKLLAISDGVVPSGLARVMHAVLSRLNPEKYEIHHLAVNYRGDPHEISWKAYPAIAGGDIYGLRRLDELNKRIQPHVIFILNDAWVVAEYLRVLKTISHTAKIAVWTLVESDPFDPDWLQDVATVSFLSTCTEFGKEQVQLALTNSRALVPAIDVIPFGVDTTRFYPLDVSVTKASLSLLDDHDISSSFIVLNANRNQPRKKIDITLKAFSLFAEGKPDNVKLYLHMGVRDVGWDILKLASRFRIEDRIIVSNTGTISQSVGDEDLNLIYNACDVGINTSSCEGWGLVSFEHAATQRAQVVPAVPSLRRLWEGSAILAPTNRTIVNDQTNINGYLVDEIALARILEHLYSDIDHRQCYAATSYAYATRHEYTWDVIASQWDKRFQSIA